VVEHQGSFRGKLAVEFCLPATSWREKAVAILIFGTEDATTALVDVELVRQVVSGSLFEELGQISADIETQQMLQLISKIRKHESSGTWDVDAVTGELARRYSLINDMKEVRCLFESLLNWKSLTRMLFPRS
jgi:hypothetical protein